MINSHVVLDPTLDIWLFLLTTHSTDACTTNTYTHYIATFYTLQEVYLHLILAHYLSLMASFWVVFIALMMAFMASVSLCLSSELKLDTQPITIISAAPAVLPNPPLSPPFAEISPDVAPLLPSPGGELPAPSGSFIPTIPSNPSPPNPDQVATVGPDFAVSPTGSELISSAFSSKFSSLYSFGAISVSVLGFLLASW